MNSTDLFFVAVCYCFYCIHGNAQFSDNFSDGNYLSSPAWWGDTSRFEVNPAEELWLNAPPATDMAYLSLLSQAMENASWEFRVRLGFNPSASNQARVYLCADQQNLKQPLNGYYVEIGNTQDDISLYVQNGTSVTRIIDGADGILNTVTVNTMVRVTRDHAGNWELWADTSGGTNYVSLGTAGDVQYTQSWYAGVQCRYTSTRSDKFFFDDFHVTGTAFTDLIKPTVTALYITGNNTLSVRFSEPVDRITAQNVLNYSADNGLGNPLSVIRDTNDIYTVLMNFSGSIASSVLYHLSITGVEDFSSNTINDTILPFAIYNALPGDIVINEIMADPDPVVGLPSAEYIELYNHTAYPVSVQNWKISCGATTKVLPAYTIPADGFVVITNEGNTSLFQQEIPLLGISSFPALTNSGMMLRLSDTGNVTIDTVFYQLSWYGNNLYDDGGYALERIHPGDVCAGEINWKASQSTLGGTPGTQNSIWSPLLQPVTAKARVIDSVNIEVSYSKRMDFSGINLAVFSLSCGNGVDAIQVVNDHTLQLTLNERLPVNTPCTVLAEPVPDCSGNLSSAFQLVLVNYKPSAFDVIITELMVDESPSVLLPENEYIELYNTLSFPLHLKNWQLINNGTRYLMPDTIIDPGTYLAVMKDVNTVYYSSIPLCGMSSFPSLTNTSGTVELRFTDSTLIHAVSYTDGWYGNPGKADGGWSLEMIDMSKPCLGSTNWKASENPNGGSPGIQNAVYGVVTDTILPYAYRTGFIFPDTIILYFSEPVLPDVALASFSIDHNLSFTGFRLSEPDLKKIYLKTSLPLSANTLYQVIAGPGISDCGDNTIIQDTLYVQLPGGLEAGDLLINEVLYDPLEGGTDYVEIYNAADYVIDLSYLYVANADTTTMFIDNPVHVAEKSMLMFPGEYIVLSENQEMVKPFYNIRSPENFVDLADFPVLSNTEGTIALADVSQQIVDVFAYNGSMHFALLNSTDGVSLERIYFNEATNNPSNWHSAAQEIGFGTPGYANSQYLPAGNTLENSVSLDNDIVSPDNDGYQDILTIRYQFDEPGYTGTITIHDASGREIRTLVNNELLGTEGYFTWDGLDEKGAKARVGIHVIYIEVFTLNGNTERMKKVCVVAARL